MVAGDVPAAGPLKWWRRSWPRSWWTARLPCSTTSWSGPHLRATCPDRCRRLPWPGPSARNSASATRRPCPSTPSCCCTQLRGRGSRRHCLMSCRAAVLHLHQLPSFARVCAVCGARSALLQAVSVRARSAAPRRCPALRLTAQRAAASILRDRIGAATAEDKALFEAFVKDLTVASSKAVRSCVVFVWAVTGARAQVQQEPWQDTDIPDEFLDPLMATLMRDPGPGLCVCGVLAAESLCSVVGCASGRQGPHPHRRPRSDHAAHPEQARVPVSRLRVCVWGRA